MIFDYLQRNPELFLFLLILLVLVSAWLGIRIRKAMANWRMRRRFRRAEDGEAWAEHMLQENDFSIIERQCTAETRVCVNDTWYSNHIRIDYVVQRDGMRYGVEVKSGEQATNPAAGATRRQLLEYYIVYRLDGLLLADYETRSLNSIRFELPEPDLPDRPETPPSWWDRWF